MRYIIAIILAAVLVSCNVTEEATLSVEVQDAWSVSNYYYLWVRMENIGTKTAYIDGYVRVYNSNSVQLYASEDNYWPAALEPGEINAASLSGYISETATSYKIVVNYGPEIVTTGDFEIY